MTDRIASDELIYTGRVAEVHRIGLRMHDGHVEPRDLVRFAPAAVVLPVRDDGRIVLIRNYRFAVGEELWELPAGSVEPDEDPAAGAARELAEETGYTCGTIRPLGWFYTAPGATTEKMHAFVATELSPGPARLETYEEIRVEPRSEEDVRQMVLDGTIHDGKTIGALSLWWMRRGG